MSDAIRLETHLRPRDAAAAGIVSHYTDLVAAPGLALTRASPVRPRQFLQLILAGDHVLRNAATGAAYRSPPALLIGLCTYRRYNLEVRGPLRVFFIQLQPGVAHAWSGRDMAALTDSCLDARTAFGDGIEELVTALAAAPSAEARVALADAWVGAQPVPRLDDIAAAARAILDAGGEEAPPLPCTLSLRQFQRRFARQIGVTPKLYARLARLAGVIAMRDSEPDLSWTRLAYANGYADQAHLTREFQAFVRAAPSRFRALQFAGDPAPLAAVA